MIAIDGHLYGCVTGVSRASMLVFRRDLWTGFMVQWVQ